MHNNFKSILWLSGHFGIVIREHVEKLVYRNAYSQVSANRTLAKLEREYGLLKRIDRGKRKTDGYKLTNPGIREFRKLFGYEPKVFNSGDKLSHSIQILNFYCHIINDLEQRGLLKDEYNIIEESRKLVFDVQKEKRYRKKDKIERFIPDAFGIYKYGNKGFVFHLEIENSERKANYVAKKTIKNYEDYFLSGIWKKEKWQPEKKIFPPILIITYSDYKSREFLRNFKNKLNLELPYYFTDYLSLKNQGISEQIWYNIKGDRVKIIS